MVARMAHAIDVKTRTMAVELDFENRDKPLAPGDVRRGALADPARAPSLFVPPGAIAPTTEKTYVDRVRDGKVEQVGVGRGVPMGDRVEVFGELAAGDLVLKRGSEVMAPGTAVTLPFGSGSPRSSTPRTPKSVLPVVHGGPRTRPGRVGPTPGTHEGDGF